MPHYQNTKNEQTTALSEKKHGFSCFYIFMESNTCLIPQIPVCTRYSICMNGYSGFRTSLESTQNISNGRLMKLFHRTRIVELQIMFHIMSHMLTHFDETSQAPFCLANSWTSSASHWFGTRRIASLKQWLVKQNHRRVQAF